MLAERKRFAAFLGSKLHKPVEVQIPLSSAVIARRLRQRPIDIGYLSARTLLNARERQLAGILLAGETTANKLPQLLVSLKNKPYASVEELRGNRLRFRASQHVRFRHPTL